MRVRADLGRGFRETKRLVRQLDLHTVCEEAGCPNIYECWADRTATFMILGDRCTRACGFCLVDTRKPLPLDPDEPARVAAAIAHLGLEHAVITSVARDDVADGGAAMFAATIAATRARTPSTLVEVLIPDCKGEAAALDVIFDARPDVLNHNLETVARLQRAARPSAAYARSLAVLARAKDAGLRTKSGLVLGMGETDAEVRGAVADLHNVGVDVLTLGQYLRPSSRHLPVVRWWTPDEFAVFGRFAEGLGFSHVESGPLVRSSYHAKRGVDAASVPTSAGSARSA
jgi:lipoic acid synthetase